MGSLVQPAVSEGCYSGGLNLALAVEFLSEIHCFPERCSHSITGGTSPSVPLTKCSSKLMNFAFFFPYHCTSYYTFKKSESLQLQMQETEN